MQAPVIRSRSGFSLVEIRWSLFPVIGMDGCNRLHRACRRLNLAGGVARDGQNAPLRGLGMPERPSCRRRIRRISGWQRGTDHPEMLQPVELGVEGPFEGQVFRVYVSEDTVGRIASAPSRAVRVAPLFVRMARRRGPGALVVWPSDPGIPGSEASSPPSRLERFRWSDQSPSYDPCGAETFAK